MRTRPAPAWARENDVPSLEEAKSQQLAEEAARERYRARATGELPLDPARAAAEATDEERARRRLSPRRANRWREVAELDSRAAALEQRQAAVGAELAAGQEQLIATQRADHEALAKWVAGQDEGERPLPSAPGVEQRIGDLQAEFEALTTAVAAVLAEKAALVERHRGRLVKDAVKARRRAVERLREAISQVEEARAEAAENVALERWAREFPGEDADAGSLGLTRMKGGRLSSTMPDFKGLALAEQVCAWLRDDAAWLDNVLEQEEQKRDELDPHFEPIWEDSDEGREAIALANQRIAAGLRPRNVTSAGWGD